jgi:chitinase
MPASLCQTCTHMREVVSAKGSRFLLCQLSQWDRRFPKYPSQPTKVCDGFEAVDATQSSDGPSTLIKVIVFAVLFGLGCTPSHANEIETTSDSKSSFCVVGYLPSYEMKQFDPAVGEHLDELIYFSAQPTSEGGLNADEVTPQAMERLREMRVHHGTRVNLALGGWGRCAGFAPMAIDTGKRSRFIDTLLRFCLDKQFDGVDFDWEFPKGKQEHAAYCSLLVETKRKFEPHALTVTVAMCASQTLDADAYRAVNRVHLMSYDRGGEEHSRFEDAVKDVKRFVNQGVPREKILLGLPFYGRSARQKPSALAYRHIVRRFDPDAEKDRAEGYFFNGLATVRQKTRHAIREGIGGVMVWELGQDAQGEKSLLRAIALETDKR